MKPGIIGYYDFSGQSTRSTEENELSVWCIYLYIYIHTSCIDSVKYVLLDSEGLIRVV